MSEEIEEADVLEFKILEIEENIDSWATERLASLSHAERDFLRDSATREILRAVPDFLSKCPKKEQESLIEKRMLKAIKQPEGDRILAEGR